jgi:hypothetical protein
VDTPSVKDYIDARFESFALIMQVGIANVGTKLAELRTEMHQGFAELIKWFVATMLAMFLATVAVMIFLFNSLAARLPPPQPAPAITSQAAPASPAQAVPAQR